MKTIEEKTQQIAEALHKSVEEALEKKRRLGQYAVIWDGEKVVRILPTGEISASFSHPKQQPKP